MITAPWLEKFPYYEQVLQESMTLAEHVLPQEFHPVCNTLLEQFDHGSSSELLGLLERKPTAEATLNDFLSLILIASLNQADAFGENNLDQVAGADLRSIEFTSGVSLDLVFHMCQMIEKEISLQHVIPTLQSIINWQKYGVELLQRPIGNECAISYSIDEAIQYRIHTVGTYYRLLASIVIGDPTVTYKYVWELLDTQLVDDQNDVGHDLYTQVNPYLPVLAKYDLLHLAQAGKNMDYVLYRHPLPDYIRSPLIDEVDQTSNRYFEDP